MSRWALVPGTHLSPDFSLLQPPWQGSENQAVPGGSHGSSLGAEEAGREQGPLSADAVWHPEQEGVVALPGGRNTGKASAGQGAATGPLCSAQC